MDIFDYIVVGAGSAGCTLAHRLASVGDYKVLLIEQGAADRSPLFRMPKGFGALLKGDRHVSRYQVTRSDVQAKDELWLRGKSLGGSSSVNGMIWIRPRPEGIQRLARYGGSEWSYESLEPHLDALDGQGSENGYFRVAPHREQYAITDKFLQACEKQGLPKQVSLTDIGARGAGYLHYNIDGSGRRQSAASVFLRRPESRQNLQVRTDLAVNRVIFKDKKAQSVLCEKNGAERLFQARKEVILSAGAIESPLILQRSGIGDPALLEELAIDLLHANSHVGSNLREHLIGGVGVETRSPLDSENRQYGGLRLLGNLVRYYASRKGPMSQSPCHAAAFLKSSDSLAAPDVMLMFSPFSRDGDDFSVRAGISLSAYAMYPESSGEVVLASKQPGVPPRIRMSYLQTEYDRRASIAGLRAVKSILEQEPLASRVLVDTSAIAEAETDDELLAIYKAQGQPGFHAVGSCAMGEATSASVVDARARVHGVTGLRVVDGSILPEMIASVTNATVMAVAMRVADLILEDAKHN
ncbi:GMC family oxidoreductase [Seongchinamella unica]|jgi:choline dehydrogenase-like flavoprotein|uniref:GMC family oxidoreductase n=1 Tax=Seongchinamella unica TaxID=2547392 RepID=A0A4R5LU88_9GAMM|nr:GMC family oxidoreductase [Seongchinamella unica]TDG14930.1 GMC family oxidoreductase [Seongchinamella unica]